MEEQKSKLTDLEKATLDFLIEYAKEKGSESLSTVAAAVAVAGAAGAMVVGAAVTAQIRGVSAGSSTPDPVDVRNVLDLFGNDLADGQMTLDRLLKVREKLLLS